jgi:hypothetical protein
MPEGGMSPTARLTGRQEASRKLSVPDPDYVAHRTSARHRPLRRAQRPGSATGESVTICAVNCANLPVLWR